MTDIGYLGCLGRTRIPGTVSVIRTCYDCRVEVWVSREMRPEVDAGRVRPLCALCMTARLATEPDAYSYIHPAQVESLEALGLLDYAAEAVEWLNHRRGK